MPQAWTLIRTHPAPGSGIARSTISNAPVGRLIWAARIFGIKRIVAPKVRIHSGTVWSDRNRKFSLQTRSRRDRDTLIRNSTRIVDDALERDPSLGRELRVRPFISHSIMSQPIVMRLDFPFNAELASIGEAGQPRAAHVSNQLNGMPLYQFGGPCFLIFPRNSRTPS